MAVEVCAPVHGPPNGVALCIGLVGLSSTLCRCTGHVHNKMILASTALAFM